MARLGGNLTKVGHPLRTIVVMGPSGYGKSTLGQALAKALGWHFIEGDEHHPPVNVDRMARGISLTDSDRAPFLDAIALELRAASDGAVAACSALRRSYRERLEEQAGRPILFVLPEVGREELARRLQDRSGHFMPPELMESQLETLERPGPGEYYVELNGQLPVDSLVAAVKARLATGRG